MIGNLARLIRILALAGIASACSTAYTNFTSQDQEDAPVQLRRIVEYQTHPDLRLRPLGCAIVLPWDSEDIPPVSSVIEESVRRHLATRVERIVVGRERDELGRRHALDLSLPQHQRALARRAGCEGLIRLRLEESTAVYALFWTRYRLGLEVSLVRAGDDVVLWRARHVAERIDGGLPLSPVGAVFSALSATRLAADEDTAHSLADDLTRRLFETWPVAR
jgi:hypothetical protein